MRTRVLRQLRRTIHLDRHTQPVAEHRAQDVAGHRGPSHAADDDAAHVGEVRETLRLRTVRVPPATMRAELGHRLEHGTGVLVSHRPDVVQIDHFFGPFGLAPGLAPGFVASGFFSASGFSASSISITGIPSRTGYR